VQKGQNGSDCWKWTGAKKRHGYGRIRINFIEYTASRLSWAVHNGRDPGSLDVCHSCDNTECCNPKHLFLGTHKENMEDAVYRGRKMGFRAVGAPDNKGEKNPMAKLTQAKADQIRKLYRAGGVSYGDLARRFGIGLSAVGKIVKGERWAADEKQREEYREDNWTAKPLV